MASLADIVITNQPQSGGVPTGGTAQLTVQANSLTGGPLTYQWYQVNATFDMITYKKGAHYPGGSTTILNATAATYTLPSNPSVPTGYWVRITNPGCGIADSNIAVVIPRPSAPTALTATASGASNVAITWAAVSGAEKYLVERRVDSTPWASAGVVPAPGVAMTDAPSAPNGVAVYRVKSLAGYAYAPTNPAESNPSGGDVANLNDASYEDLKPGITLIRAQHIVELRQAANSLAAAANLGSPFTGSQTTVASVQGTLITAAHFTDLMSAINAARAALAIPAASFGTMPISGSSVHKAQVQNLRDALQ